MTSRSRSRSPARASPARGRAAAVVAYEPATSGGDASELNEARGASRGAAVRSTAWHWLQPRMVHLATLLVVGNAALQIYYHHRAHGVYNVFQAGLAFFLSANVFVCLCEISMLLRAALVRSQANKYEKKFGGGRELELAAGFLWQPLSLRSLVDGSALSEMFSRYATLDASYADNESYSFFVDTANGMFTLVPSLLLLCGMTNELSVVGITPRLLGLISLVTFWTELYGTVVYLWSFFYHGRQRFISATATFFVVFINAVWLVGPAIGFWLSLELMQTNSIARFTAKDASWPVLVK